MWETDAVAVTLYQLVASGMFVFTGLDYWTTKMTLKSYIPVKF